METHSDEAKEAWPPLAGEDNNGGKNEEDDWELLATDEGPSFESHQNEIRKDVVVVATHPERTLRHAASSPDLRKFHLADIVEEHDETSSRDGSSFAMISGPQSVMSVSSGFSFRDAILSKSAAPVQNEDAAADQPVQQRRIKPKFVVKPIKRCSKSTGDLQSLNAIGEDDEVLGETDAMDFYHRKAKGAKNRSSGLRLRPDEAKRKAITMNKKEMQRRNNA